MSADLTVDRRIALAVLVKVEEVYRHMQPWMRDALLEDLVDIICRERHR